MYVQEVDGERRYSHARGSSPSFSASGRYLVFSESKSVVKEREEEIAKLRGEKSAELEAAAKKKESEAAKAQEERRREMMARFSRGQTRGRGRSGGRSRSGGSGTVFVLDLETGKKEKIGKARGFRVVKDGEFLVYHLPKPEEKKSGDKKTAGEKSEKQPASAGGEGRSRRPEARRRTAGRRGSGRRPGARPSRSGASGASGASASKSSDRTQLVVRNLATGKDVRYEGVSSYKLVAKDKWLLLTCSTSDKDSKVPNGLSAVKLAGGERVTLLPGKASFSGITTDPHHKVLAFTSDAVEKAAADAKKKAEEAAKKAEAKKSAEKATAKEGAEQASGAGKVAKAALPAQPEKASKAEEKDKESPRHDVYTWDFGAGPARKIITHDTKGMPADHTISSSGLSFSGDGSILSFSVRAKPEAELAKILPNEKVVVDIWHWNDGNIQPMQAKRRGSSRKSFSCVWNVKDEKMLVLGDEVIPSVRVFSRDGKWAMATDGKPYEKLVTWDGRYSDYYRVDTSTGKRTKFLERSRTSPSPSPSGRYMMHFGADYHWYLIDTSDLTRKCLTKRLRVKFESEIEDRPQPARAYGVVGWTAGERAVLINDRYDIWKYDVTNNKVTCVTNLVGRSNKMVFRYSKFDLEGDDEDLSPDESKYLPDTLWLSAKNDATKATGYYTASHTTPGDPKKVVMMDDGVGGLTRAKKADRIFFTVSDFDQFPDLWVADMKFGDMRQLTDACPEQRSVRWGSSELVNWTNSDGVALQGYLIKPEGFDPKKKYPMMVYFYERNADRVHSYVRPTPGTSPNSAYYVSNGYLWFVPDIVYTVGYPGESAEKCVISGVQHLIARGYVDKKSIGMAGHSWGGYQTAHLSTRTNLFAAAESGAPVTNMFSAYGGIRYQSGMSRQFQYEKTQSRIGGTPWQYPQRYWQNSPVFYADRVETPVLILHNDEDGAVPWTNGIEFFMALRRLGKEAYLFNYNGEPHGIRKDANKRDWARRMQEFFDHHLKGAEAPAWMKEGVRHADKAKEKIQYARSYREWQEEKKAAAIEASSNKGAPKK